MESGQLTNVFDLRSGGLVYPFVFSLSNLEIIEGLERLMDIFKERVTQKISAVLQH